MPEIVIHLFRALQPIGPHSQLYPEHHQDNQKGAIKSFIIQGSQPLSGAKAKDWRQDEV
jgi:hypothetical protein